MPGAAMNEIARAEGWPVYFRFAENLLDPEDQPKYLHRGIGLFASRDTLYDFVLPTRRRGENACVVAAI